MTLLPVPGPPLIEHHALLRLGEALASRRQDGIEDHQLLVQEDELGLALDHLVGVVEELLGGAVLRGEDLGQDGVAVAAVQPLEEVVGQVIDEVAGEEGISLQGLGMARGEELAGGVVHVVDVADRRQADAAFVERRVGVEQVLLVSAHLDARVEDASRGVAHERLDAFRDVAGVRHRSIA